MAYDYPAPKGDQMRPMASRQAEALETMSDSMVKAAERKIADYGASQMQPKAPPYAPGGMKDMSPMHKLPDGSGFFTATVETDEDY